MTAINTRILIIATLPDHLALPARDQEQPNQPATVRVDEGQTTKRMGKDAEAAR
jgi:hypothetical protein